MTFTDAVALKDPLVAVIVVLPLATAVTNPLATVAIAASLDAHVTVCPVMTAPVWLFTVAMSLAVSPSDERVTAELDRVIVVGTGVGGWGVGVLPPPGLVGVSPPHESNPSIMIGIR